MLPIALFLAFASVTHAVPFEVTNNKTFVWVKVNGSASQWTFDCPHRRLILEPYGTPVGPFESDMSGLFLAADPPAYKAIRILWVNRGTPAAEAKLQVGDEIVSIDGRKARSLEEARGLFRTLGTRRLVIRRKGQPMEVQLEARRMV